jgi:hypothetical protein
MALDAALTAAQNTTLLKNFASDADTETADQRQRKTHLRPAFEFRAR